MSENQSKMTKSKIYDLANARGENILEISYTEVLEEFFDILESYPIQISDFNENDIKKMLDALEFINVDEFLREVILAEIQPYLQI